MRSDMPCPVKTIKHEVPAAAAARIREISARLNAELAEVKAMIEAETGCRTCSVILTGDNSNTFGDIVAETRIEVRATLGDIFGPRHEAWIMREKVGMDVIF